MTLIQVQSMERPTDATPWKKRAGNFQTVIVIASVLPLIVSLVALNLAELSGAAILLTVFLPLQLLVAAIAAVFTRGRRGVADSQLNVLVFFATFFVVIMLGSILFSIISWGIKAVSPHFLYQNNVYVTPTTSLEYGGAGHALIGSLLVVGLATLIAVPLGLSVAVYLTETKGRFKGPVRFLAQSMSGLPSIVAGLFVYALFIATGTANLSGWLGSLALALLMLPTVVRMSEEVLKLVPGDLRSAALALGAPQRRTFFQVIMPTAKAGLITAVLLGVARVVGETAPLLLTTRLMSETSFNPFNGDLATLPTFIFSNLTAGFDTGRARAWAAAFLLLAVVGLIFATTRALTSQKVK
jgi:phosphate transport system permease protein